MQTINKGGFFRNTIMAICPGAMISPAVADLMPVRSGQQACPCTRGIRMMHLRLLFIACLVLSPVLGQAADDGYGYPIAGSYEATILGTPATLMPEYPEKMRTRQLVLDIIPDRQKPPIFFYDKGLRCTFAYQKRKAPLIFLIAGAGSSDRAPKLLTMMKAFYQAGFHVITLPSPSHANFIISASQSGIPGDLTEDAADLYRVMEVAWKEVEGDIEVSSFQLCGYSLGASQAAFVAKLDEDRRVFSFRKVLMINPSVSLYGSVTRIEGLLKQIPGGPKKEGIFFNRMLSKFSQFYRYGNFVAINDDFLYAMYTENIFSNEETAGLIGLTFRINLAGMIFASDVMTNSGYVVPKNRVLTPTDSIYDYFLVTTHLSFFDYFNEYFYPYFQKRRPGLTKQALIESQSLRSIEGYLKTTAKIGVMTNENDFILTKAELDYLRQLFGERAKIYPRGGHLGNLEYKDNLAYMVNFFE
jgi:hypothetical protein